MKAKNAILYGEAKHLETRMSAWSDDSYEEAPFRCEARLSDMDLYNRLAAAVHKRFPPSHWAGCGTSTSVHRVNRTSPTGGTVILMTYRGIGD